MSFTPAQLQFISEPGHCVALAGPGSGKTTALIEKVIRLLATPGTKIVAATFTRDGAKEMLTRLAKRVPRKLLEGGRIQVNTWHSLCLEHRKRHKLNRRVLSPAHQAGLVRRVLAAHLPADEIAHALQEFESIKCSLVASFENIEHAWFHAYQDELGRLDAIDLNDAVRDTALNIASRALPPFEATHLIVDETQDNDEVQFHLADTHARLNIVTSMVGDDDQCIYEWRRARGYDGMKAFAEKHHARIVSLGDNFRSRKAIVDASEKLISNNNGFRLPKTFVARRGAGGDVIVRSTGAIDTTSESIVDGIAETAQPIAALAAGLFELQVPTGSVALLARNNHQLDAAESALTRAKLKYVRSGGSIWESEPADLLMTLLATLYTFDSRGLDVALQVAGFPQPVISAVHQRHGRDTAGFILGKAKIEGFGAYDDGLQRLSRRLADLHEKKEQHQYRALIISMAALVKQVYQGQNSLYNHRKRMNLSAVAEGLASLRGPIPFRLKVARDKDSRTDTSNAVILHTFHGCKGMEFDTVFLLGVDQETIPGRSEIRAERRLLYVACTRAKNQLVVTYTPGQGSAFLAELT